MTKGSRQLSKRSTIYSKNIDKANLCHVPMFSSELFCHKVTSLTARTIFPKTSFIVRIITFNLREQIMSLLSLMNLSKSLPHVINNASIIHTYNFLSPSYVLFIPSFVFSPGLAPCFTLARVSCSRGSRGREEQ